MSDLVGQAITLLSSYMAAVAAGSVNVAQSVAARTLAELVAARLRQDGHGDAWETFAGSQRNAQVVQYLVQQALEKDDDFEARFNQAVREAVSEYSRPSRQHVTAHGPGGDQIGDNVAIGQGNYHKGDVNTTHKTTVRGMNPIVALAGVAVVVVLVLVVIANVLSALVKGIEGSGLTADSTCQQFLSTDEQTEDQAIVNIATAKGLGGYGSPLALPAVRYDCSSEPNAKLGDVIQKFKGQF